MSEIIRIADGNTPPYSLFLPEELIGYHNWVSELTKTPSGSLFAIDYLQGQGTLIDVGANVGVVSTPVAMCGSHVVSIEMIPEYCACLTSTILENRLKNVILLQAAASDERGLAQFLKDSGNGFVIPPGRGSGPSAVKLRLDDVADLIRLRDPRFLQSPLLVKIDTEGHELSVLKGASQLIEQSDPAFFFESIMVEGRNDPYDLRAIAVKKYLEKRGYKLFLHRGDRLIPRSADDVQEGWVSDFFATRHPYRWGDRIGRHYVGVLGFDDSVAWIGEMVRFPYPEHRKHAAGVLARWHRLGLRHPKFPEFHRLLREHEDAEVAAYAQSVLRDVN
jgi:FkbM family methyltransferase